MAITEFVTFKSSPAYLANPAIIVPICRKVAEFDGVLGTYTGVAMEDATVGYLLVVWKTLDHHKKMLQDPSYPTILASLAAIHTGPTTILHYEMQDDPAKALTCPLTDFTYVTLKAGKGRDAVKPFVDAVSKYIDVSNGFHRGWCVEKPNTLVTILGWASHEAHEQATKAPAFQGMVGDAMSVVTIDVKHCKVRRQT